MSVTPADGMATVPSSMASPHAELSSLRTAVEELTKRVTDIADRCAADKQDDLASDLYKVERALEDAGRRLTRMLG